LIDGERRPVGAKGVTMNETRSATGESGSGAGRLAGRVAIVTGAGRGLGRSIAAAVADEGAAVMLLGRTQETIDSAARELRDAGRDAHAITCDVADRPSVDAAVAETLDRFGRIDILINNAQGGPLGVNIPTVELSDDVALEFFRTGPLGTLHLMQAAFAALCESNHSVVVNFGSAIGVRGGAEFAGYSMAKEAIGGLTKTAALEWGRYGIRVNQVCPAGMSEAAAAFRDHDPDRWQRTMQSIPLGRMGDPYGDIGRAVVAVVSDDLGYMTGATLMLDGGQVLLR
jgi:2-hydroxycyclohexanecarboxyl-CoA dehydrogenase